MTSKSQILISQLAEHLSLLYADQDDILRYFGKLEQLIEDYRTFITLLEFPTEHEQQQQRTLLLQRTGELLAITPKEDLSTPLYRFQVERTEQVRLVLDLAEAEARRLQHHYIGTEHLLLGLIHEEEGIAAKVLTNLGVELDKVRSNAEFLMGRGDHVIEDPIGLSPRAKEVIALAIDEAHQMQHDYIGAEHLLLGLMSEGEGIAARLLMSMDVNLEKVRTQTMQMLNQME